MKLVLFYRENDEKSNKIIRWAYILMEEIGIKKLEALFWNRNLKPQKIAEGLEFHALSKCKNS